MIGAKPEAIRTAEDRQRFKNAMTEIGLRVPPSGVAYAVDEALAVAAEVGYPVIVRPAFILGGGGTGIAHDHREMQRVAERGLAASPISEILIERSVVGWKEYELEVMRDHADNVVVICSIENVDAMGVHTGESITVAPAQTLTDVEYQRMRDAAFACIRRIGVETGGSNVQFAVDPRTGEQVIIEMNPRVSRSSALASKATGFPIAKIAAKLAVGYRLDEVRNDITRETPASFEPTIDYVVTKIPRWAFEKLPGSVPVLGTQMQSVGEVMAIGRTFPESLQKALRSLETGRLRPQLRPGRARARRIRRRRARARGRGAHARAHLPDRSGAAALRLDRTGARGDRRRPVVLRPDPADRRGTRPPRGCRPRRDDARRLAAREAAGFSDAQLAYLWADRCVDGPRGAARPGRARHLQDRRHVRGRVRRAHAVSLRNLRRRGRARAGHARGGRDPRQRTQSHRPGCRVRLLLRARRVRAARRRLRDGDGQLQSRDRLHRLRHERPAVLRAAHRGRRAQRLPRAARRRDGQRGRRV